MQVITLSTLGTVAAFLLSGCDGNSIDSTELLNDPDAPPTLVQTVDVLTQLLTTGVDDTDTIMFWLCNGEDLFGPVEVENRYFADGNGTNTFARGAFEFSWQAFSSSAIEITNPQTEDRSTLDNITFTSINNQNDSFIGIESNLGTALSCVKTFN